MGIESDYNYTPQIYRRIVFAAAQGVSFREASEALRELSELNLSAKRIWRATKRIGEERVEECRQAATRYEELPLPAQRENPTAQVHQVVSVSMDGGRYQARERTPAEMPQSELDGSEQGQPVASADSCWREYKAGLLLSMTSQTHAEDPCPELPATFAHAKKMRTIAREIKGFTSEAPVSSKVEEEAPVDFKERPGRPETLVKSVVATSGDVEAFGPLLAGAAYARGFHAALRKAFLGDGSSTIWGVWRKFFSHYTPILDFVHALMYVYAAAMIGRNEREGWRDYRRWAQWLWGGEVALLLAALQARQDDLGLPEKGETGTARAQVSTSLGYLTNQRERMNYPEYRKRGLPVTTAAMESTIKQINRRIKGSDKFWDGGVEPMLRLVADRLSQTTATAKFWDQRLRRLIRSASYQQAA